jgi:hypothetical protein
MDRVYPVETLVAEKFQILCERGMGVFRAVRVCAKMDRSGSL